MARDAFSKDLDNYRRTRGLTQAELARELRVSQPHLSRLLAAGAKPGVKLRRRASELLAMESRKVSPSSEWSRAVAELAARLPAFKKLVNAAMELLNRR
ncbi:helix-turn-helix transcriptional regulator [Bradyrhizobium sp. 155]|nr:helix-turn-helix transcriptional regulator [Bradyrhizobium sp. 166]UPK10672.1 helix-turn-helix transcriptional regulator [Bradyrhizobium sp. 155]